MARAAWIRLGALAFAACGSAAQVQAPVSAPTITEPPVSYQPCSLEAGTLELNVPAEFALAASEGACLLIDESGEATFISIAEVRQDEEGSALLQQDMREFLRASGLLGESPRFTGREPGHVLGQDVEVHAFVATPPGLMTRAGFALSVPVRGGAILFVGFGETPEEVVLLRGRLGDARMGMNSAN